MERPRFHSNPEAALQRKIVVFLEECGWNVEVMHGNAFQKGIPDLYLFRKDIGHKWVDVKLPTGSVLTKAQCQKWPKWEAAGIEIHIMKSVEDYPLLFGPANWRDMWKPRYDQYVRDVVELLESEDMLDEE